MSAEDTVVAIQTDAIKSVLDLDMINRDPTDMNNHLGVNFEEIFAEPDGTHSIDCVWRNTYKCFNFWKRMCYVIATTLTSIILGSCWACCFACTAYKHIWIVAPCFKLLDMNVTCLKRFYGMWIHCICDPCCEAFALIFEAFSPTSRKLLNAI